MTKMQAKLAFQAIYDAASQAGADPAQAAARDSLHIIRNIALKAMMDLGKPTRS